ncbi:MAG: hypothetical protein PHV34_05240 [Verrucomicrobiae bacterium]|nr:hypothetical protein [Verrucomicrobiae bacterium]
MKDQRAFILILDMLAGHWAGKTTVPATGLPPPNVWGYAQAGKLPAFQDCIENGTFVKAWNKGNCNTPYGQKYLASGTYETRSVPGVDPYCLMVQGAEKETILSACKRKYPAGKVAAFGSDAWMQTGWWKATDCTMGWGSYYSDFLTSQQCFKWMLENPEWKMVLLYLPQYDLTGNCPVMGKDTAYTKDKHHSLLQLDRFLWMVKTFLQEKNWWNETGLFIGSDHGCHYGCDAAVKAGRKKGVPEKELSNYCSNHEPPYDCLVWDFEKNKPSKQRSDCCRRTTFIAGGGAWPARMRGKIVEQGEIIDFSPTIADFMKIKLPADGRSLL